MVKWTTGVLVLALMTSVSWTGWRSAAASPAAVETPAAADPYASDTATRHRQCLPNHWRGYVLQPRF